VGKTIKASKRRVTWKIAFAGDTEEHSIVLQHTLNSGKKVVFLNGSQIYEEEKVGAGMFILKAVWHAMQACGNFVLLSFAAPRCTCVGNTTCCACVIHLRMLYLLSAPSSCNLAMCTI
jgi:hypothetical protein